MKRLTFWSLILLIFTGIFGSLIIWVTPLLYNIHPYTSDNEDGVIEQAQVIIPYAPNYNPTNITNKTQKAEIKEQESRKSEPTIGDLGTFGDSAGFWNAIFSALAMVFVVFTLAHQLDKDSKDDERDRLAQFQGQCLTMLSMLSDIVSQLRVPKRVSQSIGEAYNIDLPPVWNPSSNQGQATESTQKTDSNIDSEVSGRACFKYVYDERPDRQNVREFIIGKGYTDPRAIVNADLYRDIPTVFESYFDHYFRMVYRIFKFIKESDLGDIDIEKQNKTREFCADLIRAQLSTYELALLYYNGLNPKYKTTSKSIYEHFCIFDNLDPKLLIIQSEKEYYQQVRIRHNNLDIYNDSIYYNCIAFTKPQLPKKKKSKFKLWRRIKVWFKKSRHVFKTTFSKSESSDFELTEIELKVYNILVLHSGEILSIRQLKQLTNIKEKPLRTTFAKLEREHIIRIENATNGKRYTVIKKID